MSTHEAEEGGAERSRERFQGRPLPLNSKKVTVPLLKQLARGLGVSDTDSPDELRQSIKEKLSEMGREPRAVQVRVQETTRGTRIGLQDADGIFLDLAPEELEKDPPGEEHGGATGGKSDEEDLQTLRKTLQEVSNEKETLQAEVSSLKEHCSMRHELLDTP